VQSVDESQLVSRALPPIEIVDPGPGVDVAKLAPSTSRTNPPAAPAVALVGANSEIAGPMPIVTAAFPLLLLFCALVATTLKVSGDGATNGA
jgi:hypothetical protein